MSISLRRWIRWIPDTPTEPTDTVVLTSPKGLFVDVRTILGIDEVATAAVEKTEFELLTISTDTTGPKAADELHAHQAYGRDELALSWDRLDWAFAGTAENAGNDGQGGKRRVWSHWVDSRKEDVAGVKDEGIMTPYQGEGGSEGEELELEKGRMLNPITNQLQDYEELWQEAPNEAAGNPRTKLCVVLVAENVQGGSPIGVVIRLGRYCQGVLRVGEKFVVERWLWSDQGTWKRVVRIGDGEVPCTLCCNEGDTLKLGDEVKAVEGGFDWRVSEVYTG